MRDDLIVPTQINIAYTVQVLKPCWWEEDLIANTQVHHDKYGLQYIFHAEVPSSTYKPTATYKLPLNDKSWFIYLLRVSALPYCYFPLQHPHNPRKLLTPRFTHDIWQRPTYTNVIMLKYVRCKCYLSECGTQKNQLIFSAAAAEHPFCCTSIVFSSWADWGACPQNMFWLKRWGQKKTGHSRRVDSHCVALTSRYKSLVLV